jgi:pSer/pThr/pTyr-binding forkhead associated (FHA) protein
MTALALVQVRPLPGERLEPGEETTIGRERCDVTLPNPLVSRRHAVLRNADGRLVLEDIGSRNGTFVNNDRLDEPKELSDGDEVLIGETLWRVESTAAATMIGEAPAAAGQRVPTNRGDVPPPPPPSVVAPALLPPHQPAAPAFFQPAEPSSPKRRVSAARRLEATVISYAVVLATAAGVVAYLAAR